MNEIKKELIQQIKQQEHEISELTTSRKLKKRVLKIKNKKRRNLRSVKEKLIYCACMGWSVLCAFLYEQYRLSCRTHFGFYCT